jgi:hypothetical protein
MVDEKISSAKSWRYTLLALTVIIFSFLGLDQLQKSNDSVSENIPVAVDTICPILEEYDGVSQTILFSSDNDETLAKQIERSKQSAEHNDSASCLYIESFFYANKADYDKTKSAFDKLNSRNDAESLYQANIPSSLSLAQLEELVSGVSKAKDEVYRNGSTFNP